MGQKKTKKTELKNRRQWDADNNGSIDKTELLKPGTGLLAYIRSHFLRLPITEDSSQLSSGSESRSAAAVTQAPDVRRQPAAWFAYWDESGDGSLQKEEVLRALVKTFRLAETPKTLFDMREMIDNVWGMFDLDGSGSIDVNKTTETTSKAKAKKKPARLCLEASTLA